MPRLVHDRVFGEGPEQAHQAEILALRRVMARRAVEHLGALGEGDQARVAQIRVSVRTAGAAATCRNEAEHHVVAGLESVDAFADFDDDSRAFVTADHRRGWNQSGDVTVHGVLVGMAHAGCRHLDEHLPALRRVEFDILDAPRLSDLTQNGGSGLHGWSPLGSWL